MQLEVGKRSTRKRRHEQNVQYQDDSSWDQRLQIVLTDVKDLLSVFIRHENHLSSRS